MQFYFLIAAERLISFASRPVLLFFSSASKQLIFEYPAPWGPSDPSKHRGAET